jgi:tetratricopeptide (TPR) repeat protein
VASPFETAPHVDLLHPARRLWRYRPVPGSRATRGVSDAFGRYFRATEIREEAWAGTRRPAGGFDLSASGASCALGVLEDAILGFGRTGDVPGAEIPSRYFHYVRTGDIRPLVPVLEHNRLDLVSLAALAGVIARMLHQGPAAARNAHECLALGRIYEQAGASERADACYERAIDGSAAAAGLGDAAVQRAALRRLALRYRRQCRYEDAALAWKRLADGTPADLEALQALAVHHEHRSKDLATARTMVLRALEIVVSEPERHALRHRLARIERKIGGRRTET